MSVLPLLRWVYIEAVHRALLEFTLLTTYFMPRFLLVGLSQMALSFA